MSTTTNQLTTLLAPSAANTVTSFSNTALLPLLDGGAIEYITPSDFITAVGERATDPSVPLALAVAASDRLFLDQGGGSAVALTVGMLVAAVQAALVASGGGQTGPARPVTQVQFATGVSGDVARTAFAVTLHSAPTLGNTLLLMLTSYATGDHGLTAVAAPEIPGYTLLPGALLAGYAQGVSGYTRAVQAGDGATLTIPANAGFDCAATLVELSGVIFVEGLGTLAQGGSFALAAKTNPTTNVLRYILASASAGPTKVMASSTSGVTLLALTDQTYFSDGLFSLPGDTTGTVVINYTPNPGYIGYLDVLQVNVYGA